MPTSDSRWTKVAGVMVGRRYLSLDSLAPLLEERREEDEEEVLELTAA